MKTENMNFTFKDCCTTALLFFTALFIIFGGAYVYATVFSSTYDTATPAGGDSPSEADDRMRETKAAVQERLAVEHRFALTGTEVSATDTGEHTDITTDSIVNAGTMTNAGTLGVTGNFSVNTNKFTVTAASGNTSVGGTLTVSSTLDVTGNIDPTTYETTNGGFLDEDDMASDSATGVASQQSVAAFAKANGHPDVNGTPTAVFTKFFTGTLDSDTQTNVTHSIAGGVTKILSVTCSAFNDNTNIFVISDIFTGASTTQAVKYAWDATFVYFIDVGERLQGNAYRVKVDYIL